MKTFFRVLRNIARVIDAGLRVIQILLLLVILAVVAGQFSSPPPIVPQSAALVLQPAGVLVDELSGDPLQRALAMAQGISISETLLADLLAAVELAAEDDRIRALVLDLRQMRGAGLSKLQELATQIERFKESGKPVYAFADSFGRDQYFLAAHADEVVLHPMGDILIDGYSAYIPYYKSALDKIYVDYNTWTVGEFKSLFEPETRDDMSPADREARLNYLTVLWDLYQQDVEAVRGLEAGSLQRYADEFSGLLAAAGGDAADLALGFGLVDAAEPPDVFSGRIRELVGSAEDEPDGFFSIGHADYLAAARARPPARQENRLAVIVAAGTIQAGFRPPGTVGADTLVQRIRTARNDDAVRALVLRIDSPGGSSFASELIRRELELFGDTGRPIVVSMGSVAASGGYWIAMNADEIWASPSSLTGSIGVGAAAPAVDRALEQLGINIDGVGTTELSGQMDMLQGIGDDIADYYQLSVEQIYEDFVTMIAEFRDQDVDEVYAAAEGRVWTGLQAEELGLVDRLGNLDDAIESAAELAGLVPGEFSIDRYRSQSGWADRLLLGTISLASPALKAIGMEPIVPKPLRQLLDAATEPLVFLERFDDPRNTYVYCFCDIR